MNSLTKEELTSNGFEGESLFIGIDVHKKKWAVTLRMAGNELKTFSMNPSTQELVAHVRRYYPGARYVSGYEAGFSGFWIHEALTDAGFTNLVVHPSDIPVTNKERTYKTDRRDARRLARALENGSIEGIYVPNKTMQHLRSLWRLRSRLVGEQTRYKNRIKGHLALYGHPVPPTRSAWSGAFLKALEEIEFASEAGRCYLDHCLEGLRQVRARIAKLMRELRQHVAAIDSEDIVTRLRSVPGIGTVNAIAFYCEVIDIKRFARFDKLCSYVGFVPATHSSGEREDSGRLTWRRNRYLRTLLVEAAWMAVGKDPAMTQVYVRLKKRMKPQQAITRIAKKLLRRIWSIWHSGQKYELGRSL